MREIIRFGNNLFERKCSKCKKMKEPEEYETRNVVFRTCNNCRFKAYQKGHPLSTVEDFNNRGYRVIDISRYFDTDSNYSEQAVIQEYATNVLAMSSSAAASAETYFVEEPEPEPEP